MKEDLQPLRYQVNLIYEHTPSIEVCLYRIGHKTIWQASKDGENFGTSADLTGPARDVLKRHDWDFTPIKKTHRHTIKSIAGVDVRINYTGEHKEEIVCIPGNDYDKLSADWRKVRDFIEGETGEHGRVVPTHRAGCHK